jgi:hypothetical protein
MRDAMAEARKYKRWKYYSFISKIRLEWEIFIYKLKH